MVEIKAYDKKASYDAEYVFDDFEKFTKLVPYLYPKIQGHWHIQLLELKLTQVRELLDNIKIPPEVRVEVYVEKLVLEHIEMERPDTVEKQKTVKEAINELIANYPKVIEHKAVYEILRRVGYNVSNVADTMRMLLTKTDSSIVTAKDVRLYVPDNSKVYASQVLKDFLTLDKRRWEHYNILIQEIGEEVTFYAMRKYCRKLLNEKSNFLKNMEIKDKSVYSIDAISIVRAYKLFEEATNYKQLIPILFSLERRTLLNVDCQ